MGELYEPTIQPLPIRIRHLRVGDSSDPGAVQVIDQWFVPSWTGVNGSRGFQAGVYELRLFQEGSFQLSLPNAPGDDGVLHRERFAFYTQGKRQPEVTAGAFAYGGGTYRPGDEWIEIWEGEPGKLAFVGTPLKGGMTLQDCSIGGPDALWLMKKVRETSAGVWHNAPRDVWEHYTQIWHVVAASDFDLEDGQFAWSTSQLTTGPWSYNRAANIGAEAGTAGTLRLAPRASDQWSSVGVNDFFPIGLASASKYQAWRIDATFRRSTFTGGGGCGVGLYSATVVNPAFLSITEASIVLHVVGYAEVVIENTNKAKAPGPTNVVIEGRERWIFFYLNGALLDVLPMPNVDCTVSPYVNLHQGVGFTTDWVEVEQFNVRTTHPFLMRGSEKGDYHLPGAPPHRGGLWGQYHNESALKPKIDTVDYRDNALKPTLAPYAERADASLNFGTKITGATATPVWQPAGPAGGEFFTVRWTGAIYLNDLLTTDYTFRALADDRIRVWVGKTRFGEQLIDDWTTIGHAPTVTTAGALRNTHLPVGSPNGWYPIVVEYGNEPGNSTMQLRVRKATWNTNHYVPLGASDYVIKVAESSPLLWFQLGDGRGDTTTALSYGTSGAGGTYVGFPDSTAVGPIAGLLSTEFDGVDDYVDCTDQADFAGTASMSIECWAYFDTVTEGSPLVWKTNNTAVASADGYNLYLYWDAVAAKIYFQRWTGGSADGINSTVTLAAARWYHIVATYDGTTMRLYIDGVEQGSGTASSRSLPDRTYPLLIGRVNPLWSNDWMDGKIAQVAIYSSALSAATVAAHFAAANEYSDLMLTPWGCYNQQVRYESHYDILVALTDTFGYQATLVPKSLESGEFPGTLTPHVRVGRDTAKRIENVEARDIGVEINAEEVCDILLADASGVGDPNGAAQLTAQVVNFDEAGQHLILHQEYESLAEISSVPLLEQRLRSLLALRGSVWENAATQPRGLRELVDQFPLTGELAEIAWEPGDSVRLNLPQVGIVDVNPRQILAVTRTFVPDGQQAPTVSFRQRPRSFADTLRKLQRETRQQIRYYQGQIVQVSGSLAHAPADSLVPDTLSRLTLPDKLEDVIRVELVVHIKTTAASWDVEVNGVNRLAVTTAGRYDVTPWVGFLNGIEPWMIARLVGSGGLNQYRLELLQRV